jgi:hypothetical protein
MNFPSEVAKMISYLLIGELLRYGYFQVILTKMLLIVVMGASGIAETYAATITVSSEKTDQPIAL